MIKMESITSQMEIVYKPSHAKWQWKLVIVTNNYFFLKQHLLNSIDNLVVVYGGFNCPSSKYMPHNICIF